MFVNLKVILDAETGSHFETKALIIAGSRAVYSDEGGCLAIEQVEMVNGQWQTCAGSSSEIYVQDRDILDRIANMTAVELLSLIAS